MAYYFHFDIEKIEILPFGAFLSIQDFYEHSLKENLCVLLAGPCSHIFIHFALYLVKDPTLNVYLNQINFYVFAFNLAPIYPLDGSKIIGVILETALSIEDALYFQLKISVFVFCILSVFYIQTNTMIIIGYLFVEQIKFYKDIPKILRQIYIRIDQNQYTKIKIQRKWKYKRGYKNYYLVDGKMQKENDVIFELLKNTKKQI